jgi:type IV pilus assembly protein PilV
MRCGGFSLIEVLVATLVLAVGVLGAAASQAISMRMRHDSDLMASAVRLASTLAERIRANPAAASAYMFEFDAGSGAAPAAPAVRCYSGTVCTPAQLAAFDIHDVKQSLAAAFPGGRIRVCRDQQAWNAVRQNLEWDCAGAAGAPTVIKIGWRGRWQAGSSELPPDESPRVALRVPELAP